MISMKKKDQASLLHPRNKHTGRYDFDLLIQANAALAPWVRPNKYKDLSIDFADPKAVKELNRSLLFKDYQVAYWDIPEGFLCPPIPGRADYIHHLADLLSRPNGGVIPRGKETHILDIGVGANCIYPIIGTQEYAWSFLGTDCSKEALASAEKIKEGNPFLQEALSLKHQGDSQHIFKGILGEQDRFEAVICNPPFHASLAEAQAGSRRKVRNLTKQKTNKPVLNFGGSQQELWTEGGEKAFIGRMIAESVKFKESVVWFTSLVSKEAHLEAIYQMLEKAQVAQVETISMGQGNKKSRIIAWTF